jgi:hypothetical protein
VHAVISGTSSNKLLEELPPEDFQLLAANLVSEKIAQGTVLYDTGAKVDRVYFPLSGMVSLVVVTRDGKTIEVATVGREGAIGAMAGLGFRCLPGGDDGRDPPGEGPMRSSRSRSFSAKAATSLRYRCEPQMITEPDTKNSAKLAAVAASLISKLYTGGTKAYQLISPAPRSARRPDPLPAHRVESRTAG